MMIAASLAVIALVTGLLLHHQGESRRSQIRARGAGLTRLLAHVPYAELTARHGGGNLLELLRRAGNDADLAYSAVVGPGGRPLVSAPADGVIIPPVTFAGEPSEWLSEELIAAPGGGGAFREFSAPLFHEGELVARVRIGFFEPGLSLGSQEVRQLGMVALLVFLLTPIFYLLIRREIRPLSQASEQIQNALDVGQVQPLEIHASGELHELLQRFNKLLHLAGGRIEELEFQRTRMLTSSKVLSFQKTRIEAVLQSLPDAAVVLDETGTTTYANAKMEALVGTDLEQINGRKPQEWCTEPELLAFLVRYGRERTIPQRVETVEFSPAGPAKRRLAVSGYPLFSPKQTSEIFGVLVVCRDVTQEDLARHARAEFVAHVAHELKSPLNVLGMYAEQLGGEDGASEEFRVEAVNVISDEVDRLSTLIGNLLNVTQIEMGSIQLKRQRVRLTDLLGDLLESVGRGGRADGIRFHLELPPELSPVLVDKDLLRVAVTNLLTNAIKYNRPGGTVTLAAEETPEALRILVRDDGLGIAAEEQQRIFDKFYRSESEEVQGRGGHGLGLALARDIIEMHQGTLEVQSTLGQGSEFAIVLTKRAGLVQQAI